MKTLFSLTLALLLVTGSQARSMQSHRVRAIPKNESLDGKIINGTPAELGQFPHLAHVHFYRGSSGYVCTGSMLAPNWVITAGHCVDGADRFEITVGAVNWREPEEGAVVSETTRSILHELYDQPNGLNHDIGLIELTENIETTDNIAISEISKDTTFGADVPVIVTGWGKTSDTSSSSSILMYNDGDVFTISNVQCAGTYGFDTVTPDHICIAAGPQGGTCNGDSGSPLNFREEDGRLVTIGLCSFGPSAGCESGLPEGFTRTASYIDWIEENTGLTL